MANFRCLDCGNIEPIRFDPCPSCQGGRIAEMKPKKPKRPAAAPAAPAQADSSIDIRTIKGKEPPRYRLHDMPELERVFGGGGIVQGARVLIAGPPGIGKSTLFLMIAGSVAKAYKDSRCSVIYATGEESSDRIGGRAHRLGQSVSGLRVLASQSLDAVEVAIRAHRPRVAIIDSVPTFTSDPESGGEGSIKQVRIVSRRLSTVCEKTRTTLLLIAHVTKDGIVGGPRQLEHLVDAFAMFEGDRRSPIRTLTIIKNRDGAAGESAVLEMTAGGLREVPDAASQILGERAKGVPGSVIFPAAEADRPALIEIEAMVTFAPPAADDEKVPVERVAKLGSAVNMPSDRVPRLLSLLSATTITALTGSVVDLEANTPPGARYTESAMDLAVAAAVASSALRVALPDDTVVLGTVSVTGRVKGVHRCQTRLETAMAAGFARAILPGENVRKGEVPKGMVVVPIDHISELSAWLCSIPATRVRRGSAQVSEEASSLEANVRELKPDEST